MTSADTTPSEWWEAARPGEPLLVGLLRIDLAGSTDAWKELPHQAVLDRRARYRNSVLEVVRKHGAAQPLAWQGDGVMIFFPDREAEGEPAPLVAYRAARRLWEVLRVDLRVSFRMAVHTARVPWRMDTGTIDDVVIDRCGHLEHTAPVDSIALTEDVFLSLPPDERRNIELLGVTARDGVPAYVFPAAAASRRDLKSFLEGPDLALWDAFRRFTQERMGKLSYVGFDLRKAEPPCLDLLQVFVPLDVRVRRQSMRAEALEAGAAALARAEPEGVGVPPPPFEPPWRPDNEIDGGPAEPFHTLFRDHPIMVVLGDPGSGKTTLIKWLAVVAAGGSQSMFRALGTCERLLPLPLSVGYLSRIRAGQPDASVLDAIATYFAARDLGSREDLRSFLDRCLGRGECLVLLDGLDEVETHERLAVATWLADFIASRYRNRFVVTSRQVGYVGLGLADALTVVLSPFGDDQVERYVRSFCHAYWNWERGLPGPSPRDEVPPEAREAANGLLSSLQGNLRLASLSRNPFLLSALALIHRAEGRLPRYRVEVYDRFAKALCETWDQARRLVPDAASPVLSYVGEAIPVLGHLALEMHRSFPEGVAPEPDIVRLLADGLERAKDVPRPVAEAAARSFLDKLKTKVQILQERGSGLWGFFHLTFQEFFAAVHLHADGRFADEAFPHLYDPRWEEVLRLGVAYQARIMGQPRLARAFVERVFRYQEPNPERRWLTDLLKIPVAKAALFATDIGEDALPERLLEEIADAFAAGLLDGLFPPRILDGIAATPFAARLLPRMLPALEAPDALCRAHAALALGMLQPELAIVFAARAMGPGDLLLELPVARDRGAAAAAMDALLERLRDGNVLVRITAAKALGAMRTERAMDALLSVLRDGDRMLRRAAAGALGSMRAERVVDALLAALHDEDAFVQSEAAEALGAMRAERAIDPLLAALKDGDVFAQCAAARGLGAMRTERAVDPLLAALRGGHPFVRARAARALGIVGADRAIDPLLAALKDGHASVRQEAAMALGRMRPQRAIDPLLAALGDEDESVRGDTANALGMLRAPGLAKEIVLLLGMGKLTREAAISALRPLADTETPG